MSQSSLFDDEPKKKRRWQRPARKRKEEKGLRECAASAEEPRAQVDHTASPVDHVMFITPVLDSIWLTGHVSGMPEGGTAGLFYPIHGDADGQVWHRLTRDMFFRVRDQVDTAPRERMTQAEQEELGQRYTDILDFAVMMGLLEQDACDGPGEAVAASEPVVEGKSLP